MENPLFSKKTMTSLKRTKESTDFESSTFISPFHKEAKFFGSSLPGTNYYNFINCSSKMENELLKKPAKNPKRQERMQDIETSKQNFLSFMQMALKSDLSDFEKKKASLMKKIKCIKEIPTMQTIEPLYKEYSLSQKSRKNYKNKNWSDIEIKIFFFFILAYSCILRESAENFSDEVWKKIAGMFVKKNEKIVKFKYNSLLRSHPTLISWSAEEDEFLKRIILSINEEERVRIKWADIALEMNKLSPQAVRAGKHCRERWLNHLNPDIKKGYWSTEEDLQLIEKTIKYGKKWAQIARELNGRNENSVKNRFITLTKNLRGKIKKNKKESPLNNDGFVDKLKELLIELKRKLLLESTGNSFTTIPKSRESTEKIEIDKILDNVKITTEKLLIPLENKENPASFLKEYERDPNDLMNNYESYLSVLKFMDSQGFTPFSNCENQSKELKREFPKQNIKLPGNMFQNCNVPFMKANTDSERRGSGTSKAPDSKRPSNSFISLYLTPSVNSFDNEDLLQRANFEEEIDGKSKEKSKQAFLFPKPKGKLQKNQELNEEDSNNNNMDINNIMTQSLSFAFPTLTPIISLPTASPKANYGNDFFMFPPFEKKDLSPIQSFGRLEDEDATPSGIGKFLKI